MEFILQLRLRSFRARPDGFGVVAIKCSGRLGVVTKLALV